MGGPAGPLKASSYFETFSGRVIPAHPLSLIHPHRPASNPPVVFEGKCRPLGKVDPRTADQRIRAEDEHADLSSVVPSPSPAHAQTPLTFRDGTPGRSWRDCQIGWRAFLAMTASLSLSGRCPELHWMVLAPDKMSGFASASEVPNCCNCQRPCLFARTQRHRRTFCPARLRHESTNCYAIGRACRDYILHGPAGSSSGGGSESCSCHVGVVRSAGGLSRWKWQRRRDRILQCDLGMTPMRCSQRSAGLLAVAGAGPVLCRQWSVELAGVTAAASMFASCPL